jgi:hypothetical protein
VALQVVVAGVPTLLCTSNILYMSCGLADFSPEVGDGMLVSWCDGQGEGPCLLLIVHRHQMGIEDPAV